MPQFFVLLLILAAAGLWPLGCLWAQQRPLQTQTPETIAPGNVQFEFGFDFLQDAKYPQSGLRGDLTSLGVIGVEVGLSRIAQIQVQGTLRDFLSVSSSSPAPISPQLNANGTATNDFGDFVLATKLLVVGERGKSPALGFWTAVQLPNAASSRGLGMDSTQFYGLATLGKHFGRMSTFSNLGVGVLSNPVKASQQNDVLMYGLAGIFALSSKANLAGEVFGRYSDRHKVPIGTESRSALRLGVQIWAAGFRWDVGGVAGLAKDSPRTGISFGITREFHVFKL